MSAEHFDLIVIGGGSGGMACATLLCMEIQKLKSSVCLEQSLFRVSECTNKASSASNSRVSTSAAEACCMKDTNCMRYKLYEIHTVGRRRSIQQSVDRRC